MQQGQFIGAAIIARDIQERKQALERQRCLNEASAVLLSSLDHQITLAEIARLIVPTFADYCRIALIDEQQQIQELMTHHTDPVSLDQLQALCEGYKDHASSTAGLPTLLRKGEPELISHVAESLEGFFQTSLRLFRLSVCARIWAFLC